jgi:protein-tyrosine phosphatase
MPKPLACPAIILCLRKAIEMKTPTRILMVCLGNICRSPLAEYVLRQQLQQAELAAHVQVDSAGTSGWHNGENMHQGSLKTLQQHGIDPSGFRSRQVCTHDGQDFDYLIAMDNDNLAELERLFGRQPDKIFKITDLIPELGYDHVPDPYYTGDFSETHHIVSAAAAVLVQRLQQG